MIESITLDVTQDEFEDWKKHVVTQELFKDVRKAKSEFEKDLTEGGTICQPFAIERTSNHVGIINALGAVLNIKPHEEEQESTQENV